MSVSVGNILATKGYINPNGVGLATIYIQSYSVQSIQEIGNIPFEHFGRKATEKEYEELKKKKNILTVNLLLNGKIYTENILIDKNINVKMENLEVYLYDNKPKIKFNLK